MLEDWVNDLEMVHLNKSELCDGVYTYGRPGKPKSVIEWIKMQSS